MNPGVFSEQRNRAVCMISPLRSDMSLELKLLVSLARLRVVNPQISRSRFLTPSREGTLQRTELLHRGYPSSGYSTRGNEDV